MKEFLLSKSVKILCITLILIIVFSIMGASGVSFISSGFNYLTNGLSTVSAQASNGAKKKTYDELKKENEKLKKENADLRAQIVDYYKLREENSRLWKYYGIKKEKKDYELLPATVIRRDSNDDFYSFTADMGKVNGVNVQDPVITEKGLVGFVSSVNSTSCRVTTILSPDCQAGAIDIKTKENGIVSGKPDYSDKNLTTLTKIDASGTLKKGDIIATSGLGGVYPADVIVGEIQSIKFDEYDTTKYAVVKPYEDIRKVTDVIILTDFDNKGDIIAEENN